jgi:lipoprotein-anchoring transpeptidase ErfK/SrfK
MDGSGKQPPLQNAWHVGQRLRPRSGRPCVLLAVVALAVSAGAAAAPAHAVGPPTPRVAWTARLIVPTLATGRPGGGRTLARLPVTTGWSGGPVTLLVHGAHRRGGRLWLRVGLLRRGPRRTGWIAADVAVLDRTRWRVEVSLHRRRVVIRHGGRVRWRLRAVVGAPGTPTPTGTFSLLERVRQPDAGLFPGSWVLFLSAYSTAVRWFDGNDGQVGIHGRGGASLRDPLGTARSHGCIRITNRAVERVARHVPDGSPVVITR